MDQLSPKPTNLPPKQKLCICQQIMEGANEDMEANVTTQQDDESIRIDSDQFMEEQSEPKFEYVLNQGPLLVQETFVPT